MKTQIKKVNDCKARLLIEVEEKLVEGRFQEVFKDFQRSARLPGFREGRVPQDLLEKKFQKEAEEEVLKSLIPEAYHWSLAQHKAAPVALPAISDVRVERGKKLTFTAEFEHAPGFALRHYKGIRLKRRASEVLSEDVEKGMESLRQSRADILPVLEARGVERGDFVVVDVEIWREGQYAPGKKGVLLFVEPNGADDFYEKVLGARVDEVREISATPGQPSATGASADGKPHYKVWVRGIKQKKLPELNEEFAKSFEKSSVQELKEAVRSQIAAHKRSESLEQMKSELFEKLLGLVSFPLPETLVSKQKERLIEQARRHHAETEVSAELTREALEKAARQVKLYFILRKVAELEDLEADEVEVERRLAALAEESKRPLEEVRRVFEEDLREGLREAKTIDFLIANAKFEEIKS